MFRRRVQVVSNFQYYLPNFLGGRHEFKAGFDNGYTPEDVDTLRVDDVNLTFASLPTPRGDDGADLQHAAPPGARRDEHRALRAGLLHRSAG